LPAHSFEQSLTEFGSGFIAKLRLAAVGRETADNKGASNIHIRIGRPGCHHCEVGEAREGAGRAVSPVPSRWHQRLRFPQDAAAARPPAPRRGPRPLPPRGARGPRAAGPPPGTGAGGGSPRPPCVARTEYWLFRLAASTPRRRAPP